MEGSGRGLILRHYPGMCLDGLRKTKKNVGQDSRSPGRDLNPKLPNTKQEYSPLDHDVQFKFCGGSLCVHSTNKQRRGVC
jgi:hypothetical protein